MSQVSKWNGKKIEPLWAKLWANCLKAEDFRTLTLLIMLM